MLHSRRAGATSTRPTRRVGWAATRHSEGGGVGVERRTGVAEPEYAGMGDRLRQARLAPPGAPPRGRGLRRPAGVVGVSPSLISQVETGRAKPSVNTLYALASELGISLDSLLFVDAQPPAIPDPVDGLNGVAEVVLPHDPVQRATSRSTIRLGSGVVW